jgi:hypothetical protein
MSVSYIVLLALIAFDVSEAAADPKYVMPRELVEHAREIGCTQIEDFFDVDGMTGPPYVYGYLPGRPEDSVAFWCQKRKDGERQFFLAVKAKQGSLEGPLACPRMIAWHNHPRGLDIYRDPNESLEEFTYLDSPKVKGPRGGRVLHNAIRSSVPGLSTTFYCHEGRWLVRLRH